MNLLNILLEKSPALPMPALPQESAIFPIKIGHFVRFRVKNDIKIPLSAFTETQGLLFVQIILLNLFLNLSCFPL